MANEAGGETSLATDSSTSARSNLARQSSKPAVRAAAACTCSPESANATTGIFCHSGRWRMAASKAELPPGGRSSAARTTFTGRRSSLLRTSSKLAASSTTYPAMSRPLRTMPRENAEASATKILCPLACPSVPWSQFPPAARMTSWRSRKSVTCLPNTAEPSRPLRSDPWRTVTASSVTSRISSTTMPTLLSPSLKTTTCTGSGSCPGSGA